MLAAGVLTTDRVQLLMKPGDKCFRGYGRRDGERRRKSVRGCIISQEISVLNLLIVKKGAQPFDACSRMVYLLRSCMWSLPTLLNHAHHAQDNTVHVVCSKGHRPGCRVLAKCQKMRLAVKTAT